MYNLSAKKTKFSKIWDLEERAFFVKNKESYILAKNQDFIFILKTKDMILTKYEYMYL